MTRFLLLVLSLIGCIHAFAESWPPLKPPDPLDVKWVVKNTLTRYPEVHAQHRIYLAALARIPQTPVVLEEPGKLRLTVDELAKLRREVLELDADIVFADALEHHLSLDYQAQNAYLDYLWAQENMALVENQKRLVEAYEPASQVRRDGFNTEKDLGIEKARLNIQLMKLTQDKATAALRLNTLLDRAWNAPLTPALLGAPTPLPPDRQALTRTALNSSPMARRTLAQSKRAGTLLGIAQRDPTVNAAPATHEVARWDEQRRAVSTNIVRDITVLYETARTRLDMSKQYQNNVLPRSQALSAAAMAGYKNRQIGIMQLLERYQMGLELAQEVLNARIDYERSLVNLQIAIGQVPDYAIKTMSERPLNTIRDPNAQ